MQRNRTKKYPSINTHNTAIEINCGSMFDIQLKLDYNIEKSYTLFNDFTTPIGYKLMAYTSKQLFLFICCIYWLVFTASHNIFLQDYMFWLYFFIRATNASKRKKHKCLCVAVIRQCTSSSNL